ncbi:hypothetical protein OF83DRAFT_1147047 [Amylostereum chailletii]|nr:hypothetical protein OF83DRAFT_1147047 [Amylostereum chailletii]
MNSRDEQPSMAALYTSPVSSTDTFAGSRDAVANNSTVSWTGQMSTSFAVIADQLSTTSRAIAAANAAPASKDVGPGTYAMLSSRLDAIELAQANLRADIERLKAGEAERPVSTTDEGRPHGAEDLSKRLEEFIETVKLDQTRLYARLHNSHQTITKMPILPLPTASGKPPPNFPATKGEFEHVTRERYEALLKAYGQTPKGDTNAKREALRIFIGLAAA